jgi:hypothetical protein
MPNPQATSGPRIDEIEVSVFGPGYGESIVAHVGMGRWLIVDSCVSENSGRPKALEYLEQIGVDPTTTVELVVATHWHDDHIGGILYLVERCRNAVFCCPVALSKGEFLNLAALYRKAPIGMKAGPDELRTSIELAARRSKQNGRQMLKFARADKLLWRIDFPNGVPASLTALSPSDEMTRRFLAYVVDAYARAVSGDSLSRLLAGRPNDVAVALRLDVGGRSVLLGSDLEEEGNPLVGWWAVLDCPSAQGRTSGTFKVAHHGSASGHDDRVWARLLREQSLAMLTPFRWGKHKLPTAADRERILDKTEPAYISANPDLVLPPRAKRAPKVEDLIRKATRRRRRAVGPVGQVRWRAPLEDPAAPGNVEVFDGALRLRNVA